MVANRSTGKDESRGDEGGDRGVGVSVDAIISTTGYFGHEQFHQTHLAVFVQKWLHN
jgi:hypothetical protein